MHIELELENFLKQPKMPPLRERARVAGLFLTEHEEPADVLHFITAMKSLEELYHNEHKEE